MPPRKAKTLSQKGASDSEAEAPVIKRKRTSVKASSRPKPKSRARQQSDDVEESAEDQELDSDALDESDDHRKKKKKKRKMGSTSTSKRAKPRSKKQDSEDEDEVELEDGQEVVGRVVTAPTTGLVPHGQISQNTLDFLTKLKDPACNDRQWFKLNEPVYRVAEKEWKAFIEAFTDVLIEIDTEIPPLPPKDVVHRIYRDVRFSNDKTPYKKGVSASFSRSGRKGVFAGLKPGNESMIAAGSWCPAKNELDTIRANIKRDPTRLRQVISEPEFEQYFGEAKPHPQRERQNIFGMEDELKTAPKGVAKDHQDIDLLKCRSFAVAHRFTDDEVLDPDFKDKVGIVARVMQPFVHCLNDLMTVVSDDDDDDDDDDNEDENGDENGRDEDGEDEE
ncbi:hypothetical protein P691DRAFT_709932 [Macrolepiota fuliginosa MF-IS2]|uniref:DUF2461 domain-containing protein n=1 Tax=Macrolepiota fuliginosa MF-IS2 TaxID=1400762 RepID=A0A9P6C1H8_9AGAR|nr:hypothetical protein P691DRAFT_709932 [Macrolepiota fuliginosa MF-IS2]